jgi:hypothetical protein
MSNLAARIAFASIGAVELKGVSEPVLLHAATR